jgi:hypothetical protein
MASANTSNAAPALTESVVETSLVTGAGTAAAYASAVAMVQNSLGVSTLRATAIPAAGDEIPRAYRLFAPTTQIATGAIGVR